MPGLFIPQPRGVVGTGLNVGQGARYDNALYPQAFGARGDGVTDDTEALQAWLDATASLGRRGRLPAGTYLISATLNVNNPDDAEDYYVGGVIEGDGHNLSIIKWDGATGDGSPMMVWSRYSSELRGIKLDGDYKASYGLVLHSASYSEISPSITQTRQHAIVVDNEWDGLAHGTNFECVLWRPLIRECGIVSAAALTITGADGGTYTLTVNGETTAALAYNADAATILAALEAACADAKRFSAATGVFQVEGASSPFAVYFYGVNSGEANVVSIDDALLTGPGAVSATFVATTGSRANGVHFNGIDGTNNSNSAIAIVEPTILGCVGHGILLQATGNKIYGGIYEANRDAAIYQKGEPAGSFTTDNMVQWPWMEGNGAGMINERTVRTWAALPQGGLQQMYDVSDASNASLRMGNASFAVLHQRASDSAGNATSLGINEAGYGLQQYVLAAGAGTVQPVHVSNPTDPAIVNVTHSASGARALDFSVASTYNITLDDDITALTLNPVADGHLVTIRVHHATVANKTIGWPTGALGVAWIGGAAPTLGTGGVGSIDIVKIRYSSTHTKWLEESRALGVE